jgi:hypothetical protein
MDRDNQNKVWEIKEEGEGNLIFRDIKTPGDHRWAFQRNCCNNWGIPHDHAEVRRNVLIETEHWLIKEEDIPVGALIIKTKSPGAEYAFYPTGEHVFKGVHEREKGFPHYPGVYEIMKGHHWNIESDGGVLRFVNLHSGKVYAFHPGCGADHHADVVGSRRLMN